MHLRFLIIKMCLDIEHDLKVMLLNDVAQDDGEDGYTVVTDFLSNNEYLYDDIYTKRQTTYVGDLIDKFFTFDTHRSSAGKIIYDNIEIRCPVWAFVEVISFGAFLKFYEYYYGLECPIPLSLLNPTKSLRNACAHNNCIINNLRRGTSRPGAKVVGFVSKIDSISKDVRKKHLSVRPIFEFVNLIMVYDMVVSSDVKRNRLEELNILVNARMTKHAEYYQNQQLLKSSYGFIKKIVDFIV